MSEWFGRKRPATSYIEEPKVDSRPDTLTPHLGWTQLHPCHTKKRKPNAINRDDDRGNIGNKEELQRVRGKAIFFLHDANSDLRDTDNDDDAGKVGDDYNLTWFQGRFFPSTLPTYSPTSIISPNSFVSKPWGLLGIQKHVQDECLRCSEGGYREVDLTFIRHAGIGVDGQKKAIRWKQRELTWTGGDMMRLSSDYALRESETGVRFDPCTLIDGLKALEIGRKYFPNLMNELISSQEETEIEALIVIGKMEVVLPMEFVRKGSETNSHDDNDGLWSD